MKTRREVLQGLIVSIGGASMLAACDNAARVAVSNSQSLRFFSDQELALVSRISDLLLPRTDTPGALDVNVPGFIDGLMAEWANTRSQESQHRQLTELGHMLGADFVTAADAESTLRELDRAAFSGGTGYGGYRALKGLITQSYFATEEGALLEQHWVAVPGRWDPCVDI
ncbi:MAG TPA: hypothetical protein DCS89_02365 [Gammaproteobacteria bacterium]|jgi:hypothetical protein|nr:hypothetical protein [Gammaproteobacteria bacterium]HAT25832.1 hypothetical protein [Gammaproteobacteria bacterium]HIF87018.1 gluconate 2-dehydrogenase subunit 3 family protein [Gammaproteobacteria bacterium]HIL62067.1 gluconate 2-dehydrogenase subunit 3 family protein [Porticoccaceae bacterium]|tara:strand:+ start:1474 stop:1983 length:510 start_codon:yes stop_codon:yes gene_type:complete